MAQFRLMTWNVENLFDVGDDDGPKTQRQFAAKIESLRAVIDAQQPHVLTLQEVGSESALGKLQAALTHKLPHHAVAEPDERGIRVALISRRVLHDPVEIRPFPSGLLPVQVGDDPPGSDGPRMMNQMGRGALQVTVRANNRDVQIITAHLKSKLLTFPTGGSHPTTRTSAPATPRTPCTDERPRRPRCAQTSTPSWRVGAERWPSCSRAT